MIKVKLTVNTKDLYLGLPESANEITLEQYYEFQDAYHRNKDEDRQHMVALETIAAFYDIDPDHLLGNQLTASNLERFDNAIMPIFYHLVRLFNGYQYSTDPTKAYEIGGQHFYLPYTMFGNSSPTVAEAIEVLEIKRLLNTTTKDGRFTEAVKTAAILLRKKGERLPMAQPDIDKFIDERVAFFVNSKINMLAGIDSVFFSILTIWA